MSAANIANVETSSRLEDVEVQPLDPANRLGKRKQGAPGFEGYNPREAVQESIAGGGVRVSFRLANPTHVVAYDPSDPNADAEGLVARPNVDLATEMINMGLAQRAYEASLKVIEAEDEMAGSLLDSLR